MGHGIAHRCHEPVSLMSPAMRRSVARVRPGRKYCRGLYSAKSVSSGGMVAPVAAAQIAARPSANAAQLNAAARAFASIVPTTIELTPASGNQLNPNAWP